MRLSEQTNCLDWLAPLVASYLDVAVYILDIPGGDPPTDEDPFLRYISKLPVRYTALPQSWIVSRGYVKTHIGHRGSALKVEAVYDLDCWCRFYLHLIVYSTKRLSSLYFISRFLLLCSFLWKYLTVPRFLESSIIPQDGDWSWLAVSQAVLCSSIETKFKGLRVWN